MHFVCVAAVLWLTNAQLEAAQHDAVLATQSLVSRRLGKRYMDQVLRESVKHFVKEIVFI
jgi:hypothetical protein